MSFKAFFESYFRTLSISTRFKKETIEIFKNPDSGELRSLVKRMKEGYIEAGYFDFTSYTFRFFIDEVNYYITYPTSAGDVHHFDIAERVPEFKDGMIFMGGTLQPDLRHLTLAPSNTYGGFDSSSKEVQIIKKHVILNEQFIIKIVNHEDEGIEI